MRDKLALMLGKVDLPQVLSDATDIKNGIIQNKDIIVFQKRSEEYPYIPMIDF
jgi:hypothetical protein